MARMGDSSRESGVAQLEADLEVKQVDGGSLKAGGAATMTGASGGLSLETEKAPLSEGRLGNVEDRTEVHRLIERGNQYLSQHVDLELSAKIIEEEIQALKEKANGEDDLNILMVQFIVNSIRLLVEAAFNQEKVDSLLPIVERELYSLKLPVLHPRLLAAYNKLRVALGMQPLDGEQRRLSRTDSASLEGSLRGVESSTEEKNLVSSRGEGPCMDAASKSTSLTQGERVPELLGKDEAEGQCCEGSVDPKIIIPKSEGGGVTPVVQSEQQVGEKAEKKVSPRKEESRNDLAKVLGIDLSGMTEEERMKAFDSAGYCVEHMPLINIQDSRRLTATAIGDGEDRETFLREAKTRPKPTSPGHSSREGDLPLCPQFAVAAAAPCPGPDFATTPLNAAEPLPAASPTAPLSGTARDAANGLSSPQALLLLQDQVPLKGKSRHSESCADTVSPAKAESHLTYLPKANSSGAGAKKEAFLSRASGDETEVRVLGQQQQEEGLSSEGGTSGGVVVEEGLLGSSPQTLPVPVLSPFYTPVAPPPTPVMGSHVPPFWDSSAEGWSITANLSAESREQLSSASPSFPAAAPNSSGASAVVAVLRAMEVLRAEEQLLVDYFRLAGLGTCGLNGNLLNAIRSAAPSAFTGGLFPSTGPQESPSLETPPNFASGGEGHASEKDRGGVSSAQSKAGEDESLAAGTSHERERGAASLPIFSLPPNLVSLETDDRRWTPAEGAEAFAAALLSSRVVQEEPIPESVQNRASLTATAAAPSPLLYSAAAWREAADFARVASGVAQQAEGFRVNGSQRRPLGSEASRDAAAGTGASRASSSLPVKSYRVVAARLQDRVSSEQQEGGGVPLIPTQAKAAEGVVLGVSNDESSSRPLTTGLFRREIIPPLSSSVVRVAPSPQEPQTPRFDGWACCGIKR